MALVDRAWQQQVRLGFAEIGKRVIWEINRGLAARLKRNERYCRGHWPADELGEFGNGAGRRGRPLQDQPQQPSAPLLPGLSRARLRLEVALQRQRGELVHISEHGVS